MTRHTIMIDGKRIVFKLHSYPSGPKILVEAPGIVSFDVESLAEARDILRSLYAKEAMECETRRAS